MTDVAAAIATMGLVALAGWVIQIRGWLPRGARELLATVVFTIAGPCLLLATVAQADLGQLASPAAAVTWGTTLALAVVLAVVARLGLRQASGHAAMTVLSGAYLNAGNLGIPLAVYMFGNALAVVPTMLVQLLILGPIAFAVLDRAADAAGPSNGGRGGPLRAIVRNPLTIATLIGMGLALLPWDMPEVALAPFELVGAAAPPLALLTLGMALAAGTPTVQEEPHLPAGSARLGGGPVASSKAASPTTAVVVATIARAIIHPALAWGVGTLVGVTGEALAVVVAMAALPTAQNVVVFATRYRCAVDVASRACLVTTICCGPVLMVVAALMS